MTVRSLVLALAAGIAAFLVVGIAVAEFTQPWIEFSLFVGIPAGIAAGAFTAAAVYLGLAEDAPARRRRLAGTFAAFNVGFLLGLVVLGFVGNLGVVMAIVGSIVLGLVVATVAYLRGPNGRTTPNTHDRGDTV